MQPSSVHTLSLYLVDERRSSCLWLMHMQHQHIRYVTSRSSNCALIPNTLTHTHSLGLQQCHLSDRCHDQDQSDASPPAHNSSAAAPVLALALHHNRTKGQATRASRSPRPTLPIKLLLSMAASCDSMYSMVPSSHPLCGTRLTCRHIVLAVCRLVQQMPSLTVETAAASTSWHVVSSSVGPVTRRQHR